VNAPRTGGTRTGELLAGGTSRRALHVARMRAWVGVDSLRLEAARVVLGEYGLRATGSLVSCQQDGIEAYSASYSLATDETGVVQRQPGPAVDRLERVGDGRDCGLARCEPCVRQLAGRVDLDELTLEDIGAAPAGS